MDVKLNQVAYLLTCNMDFYTLLLGLVDGENALVEVKCLYFVAKTGLSLKEAILQKNICLEMDGSGFRLKRKHNYYYQVEGL
jgi:hypothetical protein